jgi:hypothetical protein
MKDSFPLDSTPGEEPCAQVSQRGYRQQARQECHRCVQLPGFGTRTGVFYLP